MYILNKKNTFLIITNISIVLHNMCVDKALYKKFTYTAEIKK